MCLSVLRNIVENSHTILFIYFFQGRKQALKIIFNLLVVVVLVLLQAVHVVFQSIQIPLQLCQPFVLGIDDKLFPEEHNHKDIRDAVQGTPITWRRVTCQRRDGTR